jgi:branched-chain amino acid transport system substrate-binding protein
MKGNLEEMNPMHNKLLRTNRCSTKIKSLFLFGMIMLLLVTVTPNLFAQQIVKVGVLAPFTGSLSVMGNTTQAVVEVAESDIERLFPDMDIVIIAEDTETNPDVALEKIQILYNQGVQVIIGPFSSSCVEKIKPFADQNHILIISPTSTAPSLAIDDMIFRLHMNDTEKATAVIELLKQNNYQSVALIYRDDTYGNEYANAFKPMLSEMGGVLVGEVKYSPDQTDFEETVQQLNQVVQDSVGANSASPTVVISISYDEIGDIAKTASQYDALKETRWINNDDATHIDAFINDQDVKDFALQTTFTFAAAAAKEMYHPYYPHVPQCENLLTQIHKITDEQLQEDIIVYIYDSFYMASFVSVMADIFDVKEEFINVSYESFGVSNFLIFDENGDSANGVTAFHSFMESNGQTGWTLIASYQKPQPELGDMYEPYNYFEYPPLYTDREVKIGALLPLKGDNATMGLEIQKSLDMAAIDLNHYIKRNFTENSSIEIIIADTTSDPQVALEKIQQLHSQGVELFVGPLKSSELSAVASYANDNGLILISPSSTSLDLAIDDNLFRFALDNGKLANALAVYLIDEGIEFVQTVYRDDNYGAGFYTIFKDKFEALGGICGEGISYNVNTTDFNETVGLLTDGISSASTSGTEKLAVLAIALDEAVGLFNAIPEDSALRDVRWFGGDGLAKNSSIASDTTAYGFALETNFTAFSPGTASQDLFSLFEKSWRKVLEDFIGSKPTAYDYMAYDAAWFLTMISVKEDYSPTDTSRKEILSGLVDHMMAPFQFYTFNQSGDASYGYTDFYKLVDKTSGPYWDMTAKYSYQFNGEELFNFDSDPGTAVMEWSLY